jgi:4-amino-4-deoxy-L-arabinose transferase-like glycosyltransferase
MLLKATGRILIKSFTRPLAYRPLGGPVVALLGASKILTRLVSFACFGLSSGYLYRGGRQVKGRIAGAFAALIFCHSPGAIVASAFFGRDAPLYLATSAMF